MSGTYDAHVAINQTRIRRPFDRDGSRIILPFGTSWWQRGYRVHLVEPSHAFMQAQTCRIDRENWHNRVHVAWARWIAIRESGDPGEWHPARTDLRIPVGTPVDLEYGTGVCGQVLVNPSYVDEPHGDCLCGRADERLFCPRCDAVLDVRRRTS